MDICKIDTCLFRLRVPFEDLTTSVFFYVCEQGAAIIDAATYPSDVDAHIIPALEAVNIPKTAVKMILLTHHHGDHAGGLSRLAACFPDATVGTSFDTDFPNRLELLDQMTVFGNLQAVHLPGHTRVAFGFYDRQTKTLLSGDCLQLDGVGKYRNGVSNVTQYIASVNKLKGMAIERIVASHEYDPLGSTAEGAAVAQYLDQCIEIAKRKAGQGRRIGRNA